MPYNKHYFNNYLEYYADNITPRLENIDVYVKSGEDAFPVHEVSALLALTDKEVSDIMRDKHIATLDKSNFFEIMQSGSSPLCKLYKRELDRQSPYIYAPDDIAYIYELDANDVRQVCDELSLKHITASLLPLIFSKIT